MWVMYSGQINLDLLVEESSPKAGGKLESTVRGYFVSDYISYGPLLQAETELK